MLFADDVSRSYEFVERVGFPVAFGVIMLVIIAWLGRMLVVAVIDNIKAQSACLPEIKTSLQSIAERLESVCGYDGNESNRHSQKAR